MLRFLLKMIYYETCIEYCFVYNYVTIINHSIINNHNIQPYTHPQNCVCVAEATMGSPPLTTAYPKLWNTILTIKIYILYIIFCDCFEFVHTIKN